VEYYPQLNATVARGNKVPQTIIAAGMIIMKKLATLILVAAFSSLALADDVTDADELVCSVVEVRACFESTECMTVMPWELNIPQFVIVDLKKKLISTTKASGENRSSPIRTLDRSGHAIILQGTEDGRAFSFNIDKITGILTVAVARDGLTTSVFGACTNADL
jgi:hypothetical protein